jgi:hypothetical protein
MAKVTQGVKLDAINRNALYQALGFGKKLPTDNREVMVFPNITLRNRHCEPLAGIGPVTVRVRPQALWPFDPTDTQAASFERRERNRRVEIICPNCHTPNDFGSFPQHYTTPRCERWKAIKAASIPEIPEDCFRFAQFPGGYLLIRFTSEYAGLTLCSADGKEWAYENWHFVNNERFSMLWLNAMAFGDWFAEQEAFTLKKPKTFETWKAALVAYGVSGREITFRQFNDLSCNVLSNWKSARVANPNETREERLTRIRSERERTKEIIASNAAEIAVLLESLKG